jgi:hypothetical protein
MRRVKGSLPQSDLETPIGVDPAMQPAHDAQADATLELLFRRLASEQIAIEPVGRSQHAATTRLGLAKPVMLSAPKASVPADIDRLSRELSAMWHLRRNASSR